MTSPQLHMAVAQAKIDDLRRAADTYRLAHDPAQPSQPVVQLSVTLRFGSVADRRPLARLAELDRSVAPALPVLLAEVDGQLWAAVVLSNGTVIADPFRPTSAIVQLLLARAAQLCTEPRRRGFLTRVLARGHPRGDVRPRPRPDRMP